MNLIFEVADLAVASPATVSRCGMVYVQPDLLGWRPVMLSWAATLPAGLPDTLRTHIIALFDWLLPPMMRVAMKQVCARGAHASSQAHCVANSPRPAPFLCLDVSGLFAFAASRFAALDCMRIAAAMRDCAHTCLL
jgi:hypothetical protein